MKPNVNSIELAEAVSVQDMRSSDAYTIANFVSGRELMYRAAMGVYNAVAWENKKIAIISGSGNNGGDGIRPRRYSGGEGDLSDGAADLAEAVRGRSVLF